MLLTNYSPGEGYRYWSRAQILKVLFDQYVAREVRLQVRRGYGHRVHRTPYYNRPSGSHEKPVREYPDCRVSLDRTGIPNVTPPMLSRRRRLRPPASGGRERHAVLVVRVDHERSLRVARGSEKDDAHRARAL